LGSITGTLDLSQASTKFIGEAAGDSAGRAVASAGDVDGDGASDFLIGAYQSDFGGEDSGTVYLLSEPPPGAVQLSATYTAKFWGESAEDMAGSSVASGGDVNGDGFGDVLVGAVGEGTAGIYAGAAYLLLGPLLGQVALANADAKLMGESQGDLAGCSVASGGDTNGDGYDDILVGAMTAPGGAGEGIAYLVLGPVQGTFDLSGADATLQGEAVGDGAGTSVSSAGDLNGDGFMDVLVGAPLHDASANDSGIAYLLYGPISGDVALGFADARLVGTGSDEYAGASVSPAGEIDGSLGADILIGAYGNHLAGGHAGAAYLILGEGM